MKLNKRTSIYFDAGRFKDYTTFIPLLMRMLPETDGPVLELGGGFFSTPLLHWMCKEQKRRLVTYEKDPVYYELCRKFRSRYHSVRSVEDWKTLEVDGEWSIVLIDHDGFRDGMRAYSAKYFKDKADYIILHDTERPEVYGYDSIFPEFKYIYHWTACKPWTSVVSAKKEIPKWE